MARTVLANGLFLRGETMVQKRYMGRSFMLFNRNSLMIELFVQKATISLQQKQEELLQQSYREAKASR